MITNPDGSVALKYYQPQHRVLVQQTPTGTEYVFVAQANITMAWVKPADVDHLLARRKHCCGNHNRQIFYYANENDVRQWTNRGGR